VFEQSVAPCLVMIRACVGAASAETLENAAFRVSAVQGDGDVVIHIQDLAANRELAYGPYYYIPVREDEPGRNYALESAAISDEAGNIVIRGRLAGLNVEHTLSLPKDRPMLEEHIVLRNDVALAVALREFEAGFTLRVTDAAGKILPEMADDHLAAVPFLRRAEDSKAVVYDFPLRVLLDQPGFEHIPHVNVFSAGDQSRRQPAPFLRWLGVDTRQAEHRSVQFQPGADGLRHGHAARFSVRQAVAIQRQLPA
jgi:hypothetical protein